MKKSVKIISSLLVMSWAFIASCSNCDDGSSSDTNQQKSTVTDSTLVK